MFLHKGTIQYPSNGLVVIILLCIISYFTIPESVAQNLFINEVMSSNQTTIADEDGDYPDWIELYNCALFPIELNGYGISDDPSDPFKWTFPETTINPQSPFLLFASDKNRRNSGNELHTNFRISSDGEILLLTSPEGIQVCSVEVLSLETDISYSKIPDGLGEFYYTNTPTPDLPNGNTPPLPKTSKPNFSINSGRYSSPVDILLNHPNPEAVIYYTLDGSLPDTESFLYDNAIHINSTTVLRAMAYQEGFSPSDIISATYLIGIRTQLPVISVVTDPDNLWDWNTGIYVEGPNAEPEPPHHGANYHQDWIVPAHIELFMDGSELSLSSDCFIGIHGGWSRSFPRKSLKVLSINDPFKFQLFETQSIFEYENFLLRNSGNDWCWTLIHDAYMTQLSHGFGLLYQDYRPTVVYLNSEYWGIHNLREKIDRDFISQHTGADDNNIEMIKNWSFVENGDCLEFLDLMNSLEEMDLTNPDDFAQVNNLIDINNFAKYQAYEIFIANIDWPANNIRCWREIPDGKFQWIVYDTDCSYGWTTVPSDNMLARALEPDSERWLNNPRSTLLFRRLMANTEFKNLFVNSMCDLINIFFTTNRQQHFLTNISEGILDEIPAHTARWGDFGRSWSYSLGMLTTFGSNRADFVFQHLSEHLGYEDPIPLHLENYDTQKGNIWINGYRLTDESYTGYYYSEVPVKIWSEPLEGFSFDGWTGSMNSDNDTLIFYPSDEMTLTVHFGEDENQLPEIVINEINYNSNNSHPCGDWIELTTKMNHINLSNWKIKDSDDDNVFIIPSGTVLSQNEYLIITRDYDQFMEYYPDCNFFIGDMDFGLSSNGDAVRIFDQNDRLIDSVSYLPFLPWPPQANGGGSTLQLINPGLKNEYPTNWISSSTINGTPGKKNICSNQDHNTDSVILPIGFGFVNAYPNPFNSQITVEYRLPSTSGFKMSLYNISGQLVKTIADHICIGRTSYTITIDSETLASGVYFISGMNENNDMFVRKITLLK